MSNSTVGDAAIAVVRRVVDINALRALAPAARPQAITPPAPHAAPPLEPQAAASGYGLPMIGRVLNHSQPSATAVYAQLDLEPVRRALEANAQAMLKVERSAAAGAAKGPSGPVDGRSRPTGRHQPKRKSQQQPAPAHRLARQPVK